MKISASFLGCKKIGKTLSDLNLTDVDYIHVDVMDGKYVKGKTMPFSELSTIGNYTRKRLDVHFMVSKPLKLIDLYATLNVFCLTFHLDILDDLNLIINRCRDYGIKVGIAVNPSQDISLVYNYLDKIDLVLVMGVNPGLPGQKFIEDTPTKINTLRKEIEKRKLNTLISVDGGLNLENVKYLQNCDILVSGSTITNSHDYQEIITKLRN